jgi:hypothetical protein
MYILGYSYQGARLAFDSRPHTSASVSIRQHTSASIRQHTSAYVSIRQHASSYVSIRQHSRTRAPAFLLRAAHAVFEGSLLQPAKKKKCVACECLLGAYGATCSSACRTCSVAAVAAVAALLQMEPHALKEAVARGSCLEA